MRITPTLFMLATVLLATTACNGVVKPIDGTQLAATTSSIPFEGYAATAGQVVYLQVATVASPAPGNTADWAWLAPNGTESATAVAFATAATSATYTFDGTDYYRWSGTLASIPSGRWFSVGGSPTTRMIVRTQTSFNSTNINGSSILAAQVRMNLMSGSSTLVSSISCGNNRPNFDNVVSMATNLNALSPCQSSVSPILTLRVVPSAPCGGSCTVAGAVGACAIGVRVCPADGAPYCSQTVTPTAETCANAGKDDNCDGTVDNVPGLNAACMGTPAPSAGCQSGFTAPGTQKCVGSGASATLSCVVTAAVSAGGTTGGYCTPTSNDAVCGAYVGENCDTNGNPCAPGLGCGPTRASTPVPTTCQERFTIWGMNDWYFDYCNQYQSGLYPDDITAPLSTVMSPYIEGDSLDTCWRIPGSVPDSSLDPTHVQYAICCSNSGSECKQYHINRGSN